MVNAATPKLRVSEYIQVMKIKRSSHIAVTDELFNAIGAKKFRVYTQVNEDGVPYCIGLLKDSDQSDEKLRLGLNAEQRDALSKVLFSSLKEWQFEQTFWNGKAVVIESSLVLEKNKKKKVLQLVREQ